MAKSIQRLLLICALSLAAKSTEAGDLFTPYATARPISLERLNMADYRLPWLALADAPLGSFSSAYTTVSAATPKQVALPKEAADFRDWNEKRIYTSGEVGFLYGRSAGGKHSFDTEQGYIFGTVGNNNIQISAGAAYQEWNARGWRGRR